TMSSIPSLAADTNMLNLVFRIVLGVVNWAMLFLFIWVVGRATVASTRHAQAPALRARQRAAQLPERATVSASASVPTSV
ncbi:MAG: hypothetical protein ACRDHZ_24740, partial [Ktedonobacteraceae bacterium]